MMRPHELLLLAVTFMKYMRIVDLNALGAKWAVCWIHEPAHHLGRLLPFHVRHAVVPTCSLLLDDCLCLLSCFESRYPSVRASYSSVANLAFSAMRCPVHSLPMFGILSVNARGNERSALFTSSSSVVLFSFPFLI